MKRIYLHIVVGYLKERDLISPSDEHERLLINLKTILDSYASARRNSDLSHKYFTRQTSLKATF